MKEDMKQILDVIEAYDRIILFRHFRPDGDAIGSTKGLREILRLTYPEKEILLINNDQSDYLAFLGGEDDPIPDEGYADALGIVLDTATPDRISNKKFELCRELVKSFDLVHFNHRIYIISVINEFPLLSPSRLVKSFGIEPTITVSATIIRVSIVVSALYPGR